ncbi:hypothetical protein RHSIM_Rhsim06G0189800 [Rhododendron simsii]|uniref:Terpene synthase metal-binding domain-containing protein n=1 Tax=Rhododendron simsii TaxID=118357 RepID=A0A834GX20_RHOSS|nr:hypothetical protein RHSIM_Rhsim06G0189800 [Rhododendron simsii]
MGTAGSGRVRWGRRRWAGRYCGRLDMEVPEWEGEWEVNAPDQLPDYMKHFYQKILDTYNVFEAEMAKQGRLYRVEYAKSVFKDMARAYLAEAKWYHDGYVPTMEEYMPVAQASSGVRSLVTVSFVGMGELATKSAFDWIRSDPLISQATEVIGRLMDDVAGHERKEVEHFWKCKTARKAEALEWNENEGEMK